MDGGTSIVRMLCTSLFGIRQTSLGHSCPHSSNLDTIMYMVCDNSHQLRSRIVGYRIDFYHVLPDIIHAWSIRSLCHH